MTRRLALAAAIAAVLGGAPGAHAAPESILCVKVAAYAARRVVNAPKVCVPYLSVTERVGGLGGGVGGGAASDPATRP